MRNLRVLCCAVWLASSGAAVAVPPGTVSATAQATCEYRAVASRHPDPRLRNPDTLAAKLCEPRILPGDYPLARFRIERNPEQYAAFFFVNARTHYIDAQVRQAAKEGVSQVVVLGAGFDSRAYRFRKALPKIQFFEVDLPATSKEKKQAIARALGRLPSYVRYVPIDFNTQSLDAVLPAAGYDPRRKTLFILEGLVMYVSGTGIDATFAFVRRSSPPGSLVVYDYVLREVIEGKHAGLYASAAGARSVAAIGEPFVTGWTPPEAAELASRHGFEVIEDLDHRELTRRHLTGSTGQPDGRLPDWQRIISARVR